QAAAWWRPRWPGRRPAPTPLRWDGRRYRPRAAPRRRIRRCRAAWRPWRAYQGASSGADFFTTRLRPGTTSAGVASGLACSRSPDSGRPLLAAAFFVAFLAAFFAAFFVAFFAAFFVAFLAAFFVAAFLATFFAAFLPNPRRVGLPVSSRSFVTSSSVREAGSRSLGILPLSLPSEMYGP